MRLVAEFTTEPYHGEGEPPAHALAALRAVEAAGVECDFGPLGTAVSGEEDDVVTAVSEALRAALANGATRVTLQVERPEQSGRNGRAGVRKPDLQTLIDEVTRELGGPLAELPRADKQRAVRLLEERGAFAYRKSAETIAAAIGVSRFTVYNYLNRER